MIKEVVYCDRCKKEIHPIDSLHDHDLTIFVDRVADAAGGMENTYQTAQLCFNCLKISMRNIIKLFEKGEADANQIMLLLNGKPNRIKKLKMEWDT